MSSVFLDEISINPKEYAHTDSGNILSRRATILGAQNIVFNGRCLLEHNCVIRGDLRRLVASPGSANGAALAGQVTAVQAGRYLRVGEGTILRPPGKVYKG